MITNIPTSEELCTISLRLYFKAWSEIADILTEWQQFSGLDGPEWTPERGSYYIQDGPDSANSIEWREYIEAAQNDLQGVYTLIQQSQEIGLKARLCAISPFLLLKRTDVRASEQGLNKWDFTDFPTIDAAELPRLCDIFCETNLSTQFRIMYEEIRRNRNKIHHLGVYRHSLDPQVIIDMLLLTYVELYPERKWMTDRLHFATLHRWADMADSEFNERTGLLTELWLILSGISNRQFEILMGNVSSRQRYICEYCVSDAGLGGNEPFPSDIPTAYLDDSGSSIDCIVCDTRFPVTSGICSQIDCDGRVFSRSLKGEGKCLTCGWSAKEVEDDRIREEEQRQRTAHYLNAISKGGQS